MAHPDKALSQPITPEQQRKGELLKAETVQKARERDLASIETMLSDDPSQEMLEHALKFILKNAPEKRSELEQLSIGAEVQLFETLSKVVPLDENGSALLQRGKQRQKELTGPLPPYRSARENTAASDYTQKPAVKNTKDVQDSLLKEQPSTESNNSENKELENKNLEKKS